MGMTIHFFTKGDETAGSSRLRAFYVAKYLARMGLHTIVHTPSTIAVSVTRWPRKFFLLREYVRILRTIKSDDVIFLQRTIYNKYFLILIILYRLFFGRKLIFDFDDAIYIHSPLRTKILCRISDAVIVAFYTSQEWARRYNKNVYMIPTSIPFETYSRWEKDYTTIGNPWILGWIGNGVDQFVNLKLLEPVFKELQKRNIKFVFRIIGALEYKPLYQFFTDLLGDSVEFIDRLDWTKPEVIIKEVQSFDISVVPLVMDEWNRGKYSLKAIESMSLGIPTIITATEGAKRMIQNGRNGFLAATPGEWIFALTRVMAMDRELYKSIGLAGRETVKKEYSLEANVPKIRDIIMSL